MKPDYDILIAGGGLVGASLACALGHLDLKIAVVDAQPLSRPGRPGYDDRSIALAHGSRKIFEGLELWPHIALHATPIREIHVSEQGSFAAGRISSEQEGVEALGYVIEARALGAVISPLLKTLKNVEYIAPATLESVRLELDAAFVEIDQNGSKQTISARLLIAADGADSVVRADLNIPTRERDYGQSAIVVNVSPEFGHQNVAYERFTPDGPLALLPLSDNRCASVISVSTDEVDELMALNDADFADVLTQRFGERMGRFLRIGKRHAFPLRLVRATESIRERAVIIGNAAHTLHPIAGQGFNLGLRDVATLAQLIVDAPEFDSPEVLKAYADWRSRDQRNTIAFTDGLTRLWSNPLLPIRLARRAGLVAFGILPAAKHIFAKQTMGMGGRLPRLARGLPL